jgi:hypothetical protein
VTGFAAALALTSAVAPAWARELGLDVWNYPELRENLRVTEQQLHRGEADLALLHRQIAYGDRVARRLADGSLSLRDAVEELEPVCRERVGFESVCQYQYRATTFRQGVARYALRRVAVLLAHDPARRAAVTERLEAEYALLER